MSSRESELKKQFGGTLVFYGTQLIPGSLPLEPGGLNLMKSLVGAEVAETKWIISSVTIKGWRWFLINLWFSEVSHFPNLCVHKGANKNMKVAIYLILEHQAGHLLMKACHFPFYTKNNGLSFSYPKWNVDKLNNLKVLFWWLLLAVYLLPQESLKMNYFIYF